MIETLTFQDKYDYFLKLINQTRMDRFTICELTNCKIKIRYWETTRVTLKDFRFYIYQVECDFPEQSWFPTIHSVSQIKIDDLIRELVAIQDTIPELDSMFKISLAANGKFSYPNISKIRSILIKKIKSYYNDYVKHS